MFGWIRKWWARRKQNRQVTVVANPRDPNERIAVIGDDPLAAQVAARAFFSRGPVYGSVDEHGRFTIKEIKPSTCHDCGEEFDIHGNCACIDGRI